MSNTPSREDIAQTNVKESEEAIRMASEAKERDRMAGEPTNAAELQNSIASKVKKKLETDDFKVFVDENGNPVPPGAGTE